MDNYLQKFWLNWFRLALLSMFGGKAAWGCCFGVGGHSGSTVLGGIFGAGGEIGQNGKGAKIFDICFCVTFEHY